MKDNMPGSFRDPSGYVFKSEGKIVRSINSSYKSHWEKVEPFLKKMTEKGLVVPFKDAPPLDGSWKSIEVEKLPFISYPYEWSYEQYKDAALLTLQLQKLALDEGLILKDTTAYNIQFKGGKAIFIDHLSFEVWEEGVPWKAYKQFCSHFLAPIALIANVDLACSLLPRLWIDGVPLNVAASMLPKKLKLVPSMNFHLFLHAKVQEKYSNTKEQTKEVEAKNSKITKAYLKDLAESLERLILSKSMQLPKVSTEWSDYYNNTNYTDVSASNKYKIISNLAEKYSGKIAMDLGANNGHYTRAIAKHFDYALAVDMDPLAVNQHYLDLKKNEEYDNILPLIIDVSNPSPGIGFSNTERTSFIDRCENDFIIALAVIHHLRITAGIPLVMIADFMASLLSENGVLALEFVPKEDSQSQVLLTTREDIFTDYTLEGCKEAFEKRFLCISEEKIDGSLRTVLVFKKR